MDFLKQKKDPLNQLGQCLPNYGMHSSVSGTYYKLPKWCKLHNYGNIAPGIIFPGGPQSVLPLNWYLFIFRFPFIASGSSYVFYLLILDLFFKYIYIYISICSWIFCLLVFFGWFVVLLFDTMKHSRYKSGRLIHQACKRP